MSSVIDRHASSYRSTICSTSVAVVLLAGLVPALANDPWAEQGYFYLNFESKQTVGGQLFLGVEFLSNQPAGMENPFNPAHFDPYDLRQPDPNDMDEVIPHWLDPPSDSGMEDPNQPDDDVIPYPSLYEKLQQKAFSSAIFNANLKRRNCVNAVHAQVVADLSFLHMDIVRLFDPVTFRPDAGALGRRDFKFMQTGNFDPNGNPLWALIPNLGNNDPNRKKAWLACIGDSNMQVHGIAVFQRPLVFRGLGQVERDRCVVYVYSNNQARGCAGACTINDVRRAVSHVTSHEIGHVIGANAPLPPVGPVTFDQDNAGHWLCTPNPPMFTYPHTNPNIMSSGGCATLGMFRANLYPFEILDQLTFVRNVGPKCQICRDISKLVYRLLKAPPGNKNKDIYALVGHLCTVESSGEYLSPDLRHDAIEQLLVLVDRYDPISPDDIPAVVGDDGAVAALEHEFVEGGLTPAGCDRLVGDLNGDGRVDHYDMQIVAAAQGASMGDPGYNPSADLDCNGVVDLVDMQIIRALAAVDAERCPGDLDRNGVVELADLAILLSSFGISQDALPEQGDTDGDGDVDLTDLATLLEAFGTVCP